MFEIIPNVKLGLIAVSRDCFPRPLSEMRRANIAKACEIMQWCCRNLGTVTEDGFTHPEEIGQNMQTNDIVFSAADLKENGDGVHGQGH